MVLGVEYAGIAKAYPIRILDYHEIVNDEFDGEKVIVTYCPLCNSGVAFKGKINGKQLSFGVSGLLYNSDVLLYDRQSQSLWSQLKGEAISGKHSGTKLEYINATMSTWGNWKASHPNSMVLTKDTGYKRPYDEPAYVDYRTNEALMFPISAESKAFNKKELVLGISINGKHKAYAYNQLAKQKQAIIQDEFQGKTIEITYDATTNTARILTPNISATTLYWFAWYAFHSETEVY